MNIELVNHKIINYPSGSAIEIYRDLFFLIGDDAPEVIVLNRDFSIYSKIEILDFDGLRIPKKMKPDFEMATIIGDDLYVLGSGSLTPQRDKCIRIDLKNYVVNETNLDYSFKILRNENFATEINLEALTAINGHLWIFNRANTEQENTLLIVSTPFLKNEAFELKRWAIKDCFIQNVRLGISGATYCQEKDLLFVTLSAENTNNAYDDGEILGSAIGICKNPQEKLTSSTFEFDQIIILSEYLPVFANQKIESICIISVHNNLYELLLVADNDKGNSELFEILLSLKY